MPTDQVTAHLGREDDAHVAEVHVDGPQVLPVPGAAGQHGDLGQVLKCLPLPPDVAHLAHDHHVLQLVKVEVGGAEGHHQVPQSDQGRVLIGKETNLKWTSWLSVQCTAPLHYCLLLICQTPNRINKQSLTHHNMTIQNSHRSFLLILENRKLHIDAEN